MESGVEDEDEEEKNFLKVDYPDTLVFVISPNHHRTHDRTCSPRESVAGM